MIHFRAAAFSLSLLGLLAVAQARIQNTPPLQRGAALLKAGDAALAARQWPAAEQAYQQAADAFHLAQDASQEAAAYAKLASAYEQEAAGLLAPAPAGTKPPAHLPSVAVPQGKPAVPAPKTPAPPAQAVAAAKAGIAIRVPAQVASGRPFAVHVSGFAGNPGDWVTVARVGEPDKTYHEYFYANSKREADFSFVRPLDPGSYEIRVFFDQPSLKNIVQARQTFTVTGTAKARGPVPASLPRGTYQCFVYAPHLNGNGGFTMQYEVQADINLGSADYPFSYDAGAGKMRFTGGPFAGIVADTFFHAGGPAIGFDRKDGVLENCWPR